MLSSPHFENATLLPSSLCEPKVGRIWLAGVRAGNGHLAARDSLARALAERHPYLLTHETLAFERLHARLVKWGGVALKTAWTLADTPWVTYGAPVIAREVRRDAAEWLEQAHHTDVLVATHFAQALAFVSERNRLRSSVRVVSLLPDYTEPPSSFCPVGTSLRADGYIVMTESIRYELLRQGLSPQRVHVGGTAVGAAFDAAKRSSREHVWRRLSATINLGTLRPQRPTVLFLGGSAWAWRTEPVLRKLLANEQARAQLNFVIVAGRDGAFERRARNLIADTGASGLVTGFVAPEILASLMRVADVPVLGSGAPAMLQELLAVGTGPWCVFRLLAGSEDGHGQWIVRHGFGVVEPSVDRMAAKVLDFALGGRRFATLRTGFSSRASAERRRQLERAAGVGSFLDRIPLRTIDR